MARFCAHCGTAVSEGNAFCAKCGAPVGGAPGSGSDAADSPAPPVQAPAVTPQAASQPAARPVSTTLISPSGPKHSPLFKVAVIALGVIALITVAGIGGCIYVGNRVRHKISNYAQGLKNGSNPTRSPKTSNNVTRPVKSCSSSDRTGFDDYVAAAAAASIPMKPGLTLTDVWQGWKKGDADIEVLNTVTAVSRSTIDISAMRLAGKPYPGTRQLCIADMVNGRDFVTVFGDRVPDEIPGSTMFSFSKAVFQDLKAGRPAALTFYDAYKGDDSKQMVLRGLKHGTLTRVEPGDVPYSIIVNGEHKDLPAIHAKGNLYEAWVLDDGANPLVLKIIDPKTGWNVTYVKITFPVEKKIEQDLAQNGRAEIYGIYFDFDSATLRPESGPVLKEIAEALQHNPGWKIKIDGHTDNIGGDAYNLQLSQRRAGAVKQALIGEYGIVADRMTPEGFGASRPKASNDTVEGRALNRRVELVRE
jgi:outer membrane protein OmpA-like peptidoglycan-associated protein